MLFKGWLSEPHNAMVCLSRVIAGDHLSLLHYTSMKRLGGWLCRLKKRHNSKGEFYLGQNEDCSLGDSTSDSSERLLQRGSGGRSIYDFYERGVQCNQALTLQEVFC